MGILNIAQALKPDRASGVTVYTSIVFDCFTLAGGGLLVERRGGDTVVPTPHFRMQF